MPLEGEEIRAETEGGYKVLRLNLQRSLQGRRRLDDRLATEAFSPAFEEIYVTSWFRVRTGRLIIVAQRRVGQPSSAPEQVSSV